MFTCYVHVLLLGYKSILVKKKNLKYCEYYIIYYILRYNSLPKYEMEISRLKII